ncbi:MAG: outer membrane protein assembly factor BamE [Gammaproteobacteria bacterium]|nr:outer membrane protein assembly factor BamE [Gammaproteobacteria bacterium]MBT6317336.1 outer membrane protein assembly factor BamE [Gammaproteobacteria bacterium]MBT7764972.1 outer membrane protein assembly factor BamE [Gammaproteobacteria bacterium]
MPLSWINGKTRNNSSLMRTLKSWLAIASFLVLSGCNNIGSMDFPGVYKISIPQGNIITQEMVDQLRPGMTKRQVIFVMGTPLVRDPYHQDRWDYVYNFQPGGGERGQERLSVLFENDQLVSLSGDFEPTPAETAAATAPQTPR